MDSLTHFMLPVIAALATRVHMKHGLRNIILLGIATVLLDIDHFYPPLSRVLLCNIFVTVLLPLVIIFYAFYYNKSYNFKGLSILLLVFFSSHMLLDAVYGGVQVFWPLSNYLFDISIEIGISEGLIVSPIGIVLTIYLLFVIIPCYYLEKIIEIMQRKHESFRKAVKDLKI